MCHDGGCGGEIIIAYALNEENLSEVLCGLGEKIKRVYLDARLGPGKYERICRWGSNDGKGRGGVSFHVSKIFELMENRTDEMVRVSCVTVSGKERNCHFSPGVAESKGRSADDAL